MKNRRIYLAAAAAVLVTLGFPTFRVWSYGSHRRNASSSRKVDMGNLPTLFPTTSENTVTDRDTPQ
jgi:hypothetical protein